MEFEGLVRLTEEENMILRDYIDKKINEEISKLRQEIKRDNYSKDDFSKAFSGVLGRR
jgi:hypothetical protein